MPGGRGQLPTRGPQFRACPARAPSSSNDGHVAQRCTLCNIREGEGIGKGVLADEADAREFNRMGHRNWQGEPYTAMRLRSTRQVYGLPSYREGARRNGFAMRGGLQHSQRK